MLGNRLAPRASSSTSRTPPRASSRRPTATTAEPVNLGSGQEITIAELTELIAELVGFNGEIVWDTSKPDGQPRRWLDTSRAEREFGFRAGTSLRDGLQRTIDWYRTRRAEALSVAGGTA